MSIKSHFKDVLVLEFNDVWNEVPPKASPVARLSLLVLDAATRQSQRSAGT